MRIETLALSLAIAGTIGAFALGFHTTGQLVATARDVDRSYRVIDAVDQILVDVSSAGSARRAFLFDGQESDATKFVAASEEARGDVGDVRTLAAGDPTLGPLLDRVEGLVGERLASLGDSIEARRRGRITGAEPVSAAEVELMDRLRAAATRANAEERRLLGERQDRARASATVSKWREGAATLFSVVLALLAFAGVRVENARRRRSEAALARATQFLDSVVEHLPAMVFIKDASSLRFERINHAGEILLGVSRSDVIGKSDADLFPEEQASFFQEKDRQTLERGAVLDISEEPIDGADGRRWLHTRKVPLLEDGKARYLLGISVDITDRKEIAVALERAKESAETANRELESFSYSVAHDLRAPLRSIDGFSRALLEDAGDRLDAESRGHVDRVIAAAHRMAQLIDDMLELSRVSRTDLTREDVDLSALAAQSVRDLLPAAEGRKVSVNIEASLKTRADPRLVRVVLDNLLGNAIKFTAKRPEATIDFGARTDAGECVFFVRDNGAGFDNQYAHKLFGVFQRLHGTRDFPGTGIGLATVQRVVNRHGGRVWGDGELGKGATFFFTLGEGRDARDVEYQGRISKKWPIARAR